MSVHWHAPYVEVRSRQGHLVDWLNCQCRANGTGELYTYLPLTDTNAERQLEVPPQSIQNTDYGFSVGRGAFNFTKAVGNWLAVSTRIRLNTVGENNGEVDVYIDGKKVIQVRGLELRCTAEGRIQGMHFQTFFGGRSRFVLIMLHISALLNRSLTDRQLPGLGVSEGSAGLVCRYHGCYR